MNPIRAAWAEGRAPACAWLGLTDAYVAEMTAIEGYDAAVVDMQHGLMAEEQALAMMRGLQRYRAGPRCGAIVRVPKLDSALIGKALDQGADGIICPLVNSAEEARQLAAACYYPPHGSRSFGPARASLNRTPPTGGTYFHDVAHPAGPARPVVFAMVETAAGLRAADEIAAVDGVDGIFIGPFDLSIALGEPLQASGGKKTAAGIDACLAACRRHGKRIGIYTGSADDAAGWARRGFDLVFASADAPTVQAGLAAQLRKYRTATAGKGGGAKL